MNEIVQHITDGFTGMIQPLAEGIKTGFTYLLYQDPTAEVKALSDVAQVGLVVGGIALAVGLVFGVFKMIRCLRGH